jgi:Ring hydroxylating alpha subunit (catalytic domain)
MGKLDLTVELWGSSLDVGMTDALIVDGPMELGLELMPVVSPDILDTKRELFDDVIDEIDRIGLSVSVVDLECPDARRIVDGSILEPADFLAALASEGQELDVHQDVMARTSRSLQGCSNGFQAFPSPLFRTMPSLSIGSRFRPMKPSPGPAGWFMRMRSKASTTLVEDVVWMADAFNVDDKAIVERQAAGIMSPAYKPGSLQSPPENEMRKFLGHYLSLVQS